MAKNKSLDTLENRLVNMINELAKQVKQQRNDQIAPNGYFVLPALTADPAGAPDGSMYYKTGTAKVRKKTGGTWSDV